MTRMLAVLDDGSAVDFPSWLGFVSVATATPEEAGGPVLSDLRGAGGVHVVWINPAHVEMVVEVREEAT